MPNPRFERDAPPASFACCLRAPQAKRWASQTSAFVRNLTIVLAALSVALGVFVESFLSLLEFRISSAAELRWSLIIGMPIVLFVSYVWLNRQPAQTALAAAVQSIGLLALFLAPCWWVVRHAQ